MELTLKALEAEGFKPSVSSGWTGNLMKHTIKRVVTDGHVLLLTEALKKGPAKTMRERRSPKRPHEVSIKAALVQIMEPAVEKNTVTLEYDGILREPYGHVEEHVYCRFISSKLKDRVFLDPWKLAYVMKSLPAGPDIVLKAASHVSASTCALTINRNGSGCIGLIMPVRAIREGK